MKITTRCACHFISASDEGLWQANSRLRVIQKSKKKTWRRSISPTTKINIGPGYENGYGYTRVCRFECSVGIFVALCGNRVAPAQETDPP